MLFKDQEARISNLVANAVSAKTSVQIKKEIMTSNKSKTATMTYKTDKEDGFITVEKKTTNQSYRMQRLIGTKLHKRKKISEQMP